MRNKFADLIYKYGKKNNKICVLVADISPAGSMTKFGGTIQRDLLILE